MSFTIFKYYPLSILLTLGITVASLMPVPHTELNNVRFIDKWVHFVMYGSLSLALWFEYWRQHSRGINLRSLLVCWLYPVGLGGLMEILQATCTGGRRSGDWLDVLANGTGATLALVAVLIFAFSSSKMTKKS